MTYKILLLTVSLTIVLNIDLINGENKFQKNYSSKNINKSKISSATKHYKLKPTNNVNPGDIIHQTAETKAQHSIVQTGKDLKTAAGHHGGGGGGGGGGGHGGHGYFQYARVPNYGTWEFGYRRGNPYHFREQHEQGHGHQFKSKVRWGDKHGGYGEHYYDYNHAPKHGKGGYGGGHGGGHGGGGYGHG